MRILAKIFLLGAVLLVMGQGCSISFRTGAEDGGVFISKDRGQTWEQRVFVREVKKGKLETIDTLDVNRMIMSGRDSRVLYLATVANGLYASSFQGEQWRQLFAERTVLDGFVDAENANRLVMALPSQIILSEDGGEQWKLAYEEQVPRAAFTVIRQSPRNPRLVFAGLSDGRLLVSRDRGIQWARLAQFERENIVEIFLSKHNPDRLFVVTNQGVQRSDNGGTDWVNVVETVAREYPGLTETISAAAFHPGAADGAEMIVFASAYGLAVTEDGGNSWRVPSLVQPPRRVAITTVAIDPRERKRFYYTTVGALYRTNDGGNVWRFFPLPSTRAPKSLVVDWYNSEIMYVGVQRIKK